MWWGSGPRLHWLMEGVSGSGNASVPRLAAPSALTAPSSGACFQACLQTSCQTRSLERRTRDAPRCGRPCRWAASSLFLRPASGAQHHRRSPPYPTHTHIDSGLLMCNSPTAPCTERLSGMGTRSGSRVLGPDEGGPQAPGCGKALLQSRPHMQRCQATWARTAGLDGL